MRVSRIASAFVCFSLAIAGCASSDANEAARQSHDAQMRARMSDYGLEYVRWWTDPSEQTEYVLGHKGSDWQRDYSLVLFRDDGEQPKIVDLQGIDLTKQWVDPEGRVWSLPAFVTDEAKATNRVFIDKPSGLFVAYDLKSSPRAISVGRMNSADGWLFTDTLPQQAHSHIFVEANGPQIVVSENWSFKIHGLKELRPYHWVYSPDPQNPMRYTRTDSYR